MFKLNVNHEDDNTINAFINNPERSKELKALLLNEVVNHIYEQDGNVCVSEVLQKCVEKHAASVEEAIAISIIVVPFMKTLIEANDRLETEKTNPKTDTNSKNVDWIKDIFRGV